MNIDDLSLFRLHIRTFDTAFVPEYSNINLGVNSPTGYILPDIKSLINHIDSSLKVIFNFQENFTHNLTLQNLNNLKMIGYYHGNSYMNTTSFQFDIKNAYDNPIRLENSVIRVYILNLVNAFSNKVYKIGFEIFDDC